MTQRRARSAAVSPYGGASSSTTSSTSSSVTPRNGSTRAWRGVRAQVLAASRICWLCGKPGADTVDHVVPVSLGGALLDLANLRPAHESCNKARGNRAPQNLGRTSREW